MAEHVLMAASILSADFSRLGEQIGLVEQAGADWIHIDVMDGHFVPNLTVGAPVVRALKRIATVPLDVHLMIDNVGETVAWYLDAGADSVTVHAEACDHLHRVIQAIHAAGARAGVSLNPATPPALLTEVLAEVELVLVMSVNPGFGGQAFIPASVEKICEVASMIADCGSSALVQVDGGIDAATAPLVAGAGARVLVAGNAVFGSADPASALREIRAAADGAIVE